MATGGEKAAQKARSNIYRLLKFRPRSEAEVREKLFGKKFSAKIIDKTVKYFKECGFLDDRRFARGWIRARLNRPFGSKRIHHELIQKGIDRNIIKEELDEALRHYCEEDTVFHLARKRMEKYRHLEKNKARRRLAGFLSRRGFSRQTILTAVHRIR